MGRYPSISRNSLSYLISHLHYVIVGIVISAFRLKNVRPMFVVGVGHTGTTVVCNKIGETREVFACPQETEMFLGGFFRRYFYTKCLQGGAYARNKDFFLEKTPLHREELPQILKYYPDAVILVTYRDIRETIASQLSRKGFSKDVIKGTFGDFVKFYIQLLKFPSGNMHIIHLATLEPDLQSIFECYNLTTSRSSFQQHHRRNLVEKLFEILGYGYEVSEHEKLRFLQIRDNVKSDNTSAMKFLETYEHLDKILKLDADLRKLLEISNDWYH